MIAHGDDEKLYLLKFIEEDFPEFENETSPPLAQIKHEISLYFKKNLKSFLTPIHLNGTNFQKNTWEKLLSIPYGNTSSYSELATSLEKPTAYRAVALANSQNKLTIIVPCHRVIYKNGSLGGYAGGIERKQRLLAHENSMLWR